MFKKSVSYTHLDVYKRQMKYKTSLDSLMDLVIGFNKISMIKNTPESNLGNFVCDLILDFINRELKDTLEGLPCIVVLNNGGFRSSLPEGQISIRDIYSVMPFDTVSYTHLDVYKRQFAILAKLRNLKRNCEVRNLSSLIGIMMTFQGFPKLSIKF